MRRISGLPIDYPALAVASNIWRAAMAMKLKLERSVLRSYRLTWSGFSTLFIVWVWGPAEVRDIARLQGVSRPTITSNLTMLERRGLCVRASSPDDGRLVTASLTPAGEALIKELFPRFNRGEQEISSVLDPEERAEIARLLRKVVDGITRNDTAEPQSPQGTSRAATRARKTSVNRKRNRRSA